jgi:micrococcal nuclease
LSARRLRPFLAATAAVLAAVCAAGVRPASPSVPARAGDVLKGLVTTVYDGDTIRVRLHGLGEEKVRLIGIDTPELDDEREPVRLLAFLAKRYAFSRLYRTTVTLVRGPEERDNYGRLLAFVRTEAGENFNVRLVRDGYAHAFLKFPFDEQVRRELREAEAEARRAGRGLWRAEPYPVIAAEAASGRAGEVLTVRFLCRRQYKRGGFHLLEAEGAAFDAAIPLEVFKTLPGSLDFEGRTLEATGLVELYKGRPQIMIGLPVQLVRTGGKE